MTRLMAMAAWVSAGRVKWVYIAVVLSEEWPSQS